MANDFTTTPRSRKERYLVLLCYAAVYLVWSGTYLAIRVAVQTITPFEVVGLRFLGGGLFFLTFALVTGRFKRLPTWQEVGASVFLGVFLLIGGNGLVTVAEKNVDSYIAALVVASTPMGVALFDWILVRKKISLTGMVGILLGIAGVCTLLCDSRSASLSFSPPVLLVIGGMLSWAFATSLGHRTKVFPDVFVNSGIQMTFVGGACMLALQPMYPSTSALAGTFSGASVAGLLYLMLLGSAAFVAYNYLIQHEPAIRVVSYAFVNPVLALFLGLVLAGETPQPLLVPGVAMILAGLFAMLYGDAVFGRKKAAGKR